MTDTTTIQTPTRMAIFPKVTDLPHASRKAVTEYLELFDRLDALTTRHQTLTDPATIDAAARADVEARATAVRAGREAITVKANAAAKLEAEAAAADAELRAVIEAIGQVSDEVQAAMVAVWDDDEASGRNDATRAAAIYLDLVQSITSARQAAIAAQTLPMFVQRLAHHHVIGSDTPPLRYLPPHRPIPVLGLNLDAHAPMPIDTFTTLLASDATELTAFATNPYSGKV